MTTVPNGKWFTEIDARDELEFLLGLDPHRGIGTTTELRRGMVYRGQASSAWKLLPSLYRHGFSKDSEIELVEWHTTRAFFLQADEIGLPLPTDSERYREEFDKTFSTSYALASPYWPPKEFFALWGLMQHHGLPTRLLDVTRNPFVAMYFAASECVSRLSDGVAMEEESFSVWALDLRGNGVKERELKGVVFDHDLRFVSPPKAENRNLHAQEGGFLVAHVLQEKDRSLPFEALLERSLGTSPMTRLWKINLPIKFAGALLKRLSSGGINAARLFPNYSGVVRAMEEQRYWPR